VVIKNDPILMVDAQKITRFVTQTVVIYSIFAFIISMIREIVKDIEDKEGDEKTGTKTMIIQWGLQKTKAVIYFLIISMMSILVFTIFHVHTYQWTQLAIYLGVAVGIPLIYFLINLIKAENKKDFKDLSLLAKIIMIAGILSMQLFYISYGS
jgi:4-hydroxybenzoate polyprenyltransferase